MHITPPRSRGLSLHSDTHDVLVLQVSGTKHWQVFEPAPPDTDLDDPAKEPPLRLDTELARGDGLYLPRGVPHRVASTTATSIHLTIGFVAPSWGDVLKDVVGNVVAEVSQEAAFCAPLPAGFATDKAAFSEAMAQRLRDLADRIGSVDPSQAADWVTRRFWADRAPILSGQLAQLIDLPELSRESVLARRPASIAQVSQSGDMLTLILGDRSLRLPAKLKSVMDFIVAKATFTLRELDPYLDEPSQLVLVRKAGA